MPVVGNVDMGYDTARPVPMPTGTDREVLNIRPLLIDPEIEGGFVLQGFVDVVSFGADPTGVSDSLAAFNAAMASFAYANTSQTVQTGGVIYVPPGTYYVSGSIDTHGKFGLAIMGGGMNRTVINAGSGNYPVFKDVGTAVDGNAKVRITDLTIVGGGSGNTNAHGIQWDFMNYGTIANVNGGGCNHLFDISNAWQNNLENVFSNSQFNPKNNVSLYSRPQGVGSTNNVLNIVNASFYFDVQYGIRSEFFTGGVWTNVQVGGSGTTCISLGDPSSGAAPLVFLNATNILVDTVAGNGFELIKGSGASAGDITITNLWAGTTGTTAGKAVYFKNCDRVTIAGAEIITCDYGLYLEGCNNCNVSGLTVRNYNSHNNGHGAVVADGGLSNNFSVGQITTTTTLIGYNGYQELNTPFGNSLFGFGAGIFTPAIIFGAGTNHDATYGTTDGRYEVVGRRVLASIFMTVSNKGTDVGQAIVTGLPFSSGGATSEFGALSLVALNNVAGLAVGAIIGQVAPLASVMSLNIQGPTGLNSGAAAPDNTNFLNTGGGSVVLGNINYIKA